MNVLTEKPSAWVPITLTVVIIGMIALYISRVLPTEPTSDEGLMAHSFQLWAVLEFVAILFFAFKWLPREPHEAWKVIALQIAFAIVPFAIVFLNHW